MIISGLARISIINGLLDVFGAKLRRGDNIIIPRSRQVPIKVIEESDIEIYGDESDLVKYLDFNPIPSSWKKIVNHITNEDSKVIIVIGDADVGKSGFTLYTANILLKENKRVAIIDSDIGQSDIGPPCTIGLSIVSRQNPTYWDLPLIDAYFVGDKSPAGHLLPMVIGTREMINRAMMMNADRILINTTGFIYGGVGFTLKRYKIEAVKPDLIVAIQRKDEAEHILRLFEDRFKIFRVNAPEAISRKTVRERIVYRNVSMTKYFVSSSESILSLNKVKIFNMISGKIIRNKKLAMRIISLINKSPETIIYDKKSIIIIFNEKLNKEKFNLLKKTLSSLYEKPRIVYTTSYRGLLLGLYNKNNVFMGVGRLEEINFKKGILRITSTIKNTNEVAYIYFGYITLNKNFMENHRFKPGQGLI